MKRIDFSIFLKKTLDFPGGGRYNKTRSPARTPKEYAPVAQLDRVSDYESEGREFESLPARQNTICRFAGGVFLCLEEMNFDNCVTDTMLTEM